MVHLRAVWCAFPGNDWIQVAMIIINIKNHAEMAKMAEVYPEWIENL
jgi:hypothetical protein